ncbi:MAG: VOC family protein [Thermoanaerobaculia bacterium]
MKLERLDHVAIQVADPAVSVAWYLEVLGFERRYADVWRDFPAFVCIGDSALAIFPRTVDSEAGVRLTGASEVRHIAFRADRENFERAREELSARGIPVAFEDHQISHSIYFDDPDGFHLEITTYEIPGRPASDG